MDKRIGKHGGDAPGVCAVTLQPCAGRHATHYSIGDGYYIAILEKAAKKMSANEIESIKKECRGLIPVTTQLKSKSVNLEKEK